MSNNIILTTESNPIDLPVEERLEIITAECVFGINIFRDLFLEATNSQNVMTRPIWTLMNKLPMFKDSQCGDLTNSKWLEDRVVNIPSSTTS